MWWCVGVAWGGGVVGVSLCWGGRRGRSAGAEGSGRAVAVFLEESGKLVPLRILVVFAPGWVRRLAAIDWALLGFTSGVAFTAYEDSLRQIALQRSIFGVFDRGLTYSLNPWASGGFVSSDGVAVSSGHHIWTATTAMGVGLGIA